MRNVSSEHRGDFLRSSERGPHPACGHSLPLGEGLYGRPEARPTGGGELEKRHIDPLRGYTGAYYLRKRKKAGGVVAPGSWIVNYDR
jgi:hypothetical protein